MMKSKSVVLIPARNEQNTIGAIVKGVNQLLGLDVVVIDDASSDDTLMEANEAGAIVLPLTLHLGNWAAIQTGMLYALQHEYDFVITMDADGQHNAAAIKQLMTALQQQEADVVIGSYPGRVSELRGLAWSFFRRLSGLQVRDLTSGFRVYSRAAIQILVSDELLFLGYQDIGVLLMMKSRGLKVVEQEVTMQRRLVGQSRVYYSWLAIANYFLQTTILCLSKKNHKRLPLAGTS